MNILFIHQNFPGQYKHLAPILAQQHGHRVVALTINEPGQPIPGVQVVRYQVPRGNTPGIHPWVVETETKVLRGEAAARAAYQLKQQGFTPDVICAHPGWGEALFIKDVWPDTPLLCFLEFFYHARGADVGFDPEYPSKEWTDACKLRMKNAYALLSLDAMDAGISPTAWQRAQYPAEYQPRIEVVHDGVDTRQITPNAQAFVKIQKAGQDLVFRPGDPLVTFVNRNLEPYRGCHSFFRALPQIQRDNPEAHVLIIGGDGVSYGSALPEGQTYKQKYLAEVGEQLDMQRIHFVGHVPYSVFINALQVSAAHVYLTYPFVLSWSMLEAMAAGALVIGSATQPVTEVIEHEVNGLLVDFFAPAQIAESVTRVLRDPQSMLPIRANARQTVIDRYDLLTVCLPEQVALIESLARTAPCHA